MKENANLQKDVYEELKWDPRINEGDIGVSVSSGIVTLSGSSTTYAEKWAAEEAAKKVTGVSAVVNKIDVKLAGIHTKDDQDIAKAALHALQWNVWVPDESIKIVVDSGWVTLSGNVKANFEKQTAENVVKYLSGVRGVSNNITVEPSVKAKDIQYQIKRALHRHAEEDANAIHVDVTDGEVKLTGRVHSWAEKNEAEWAAFGTLGVRKVKNEVSVTQ
ncbi:MAG: BON domain-containing protein [Bdellovibrionales bacterium]